MDTSMTTTSAWKTIGMSPKAMKSGMAVLEKYCRTQYGVTVEDTDKNKGFGARLQICYQASGTKYVLLLLLLMAYAVLGGVMFLYIERDIEQHTIQASITTNQLQRQLLIRNLTAELQDLTGVNLSDLCGDHCVQALTDIIKKQYDTYTGAINSESEPRYSWGNLWTTTFYAFTLFTTIGYGNMSCKTKLGKAATIVYSLFGIPLMLTVLDHWGKLMFNGAQALWYRLLKFARWNARRFYKMMMRERAQDSEPTTPALLKQQDKDDNDITDTDSDDLVNKIEDTVPLSLTLAIVILYTFGCAAMFKLWETEWSYFEAFYFFFISLSTIGLGDQVPEHPKYALASFVPFVIGLSLVSMCASVVGARIEARYMAALQMVEQQAAEEQATVAGDPSSVGGEVELGPGVTPPIVLEPAPPGRQQQPIGEQVGLPARRSPKRSPSALSGVVQFRDRTGTNETRGSSRASMDAPPAVLGILRARWHQQHSATFSRTSSDSMERFSMPIFTNRLSVPMTPNTPQTQTHRLSAFRPDETEEEIRFMDAIRETDELDIVPKQTRF